MKNDIEIKIVDTFKLSSLGNGKFIFITQFPEGIIPKIGDFLIYSNDEFWRISGIATSAIDKNGRDLLQERRYENLWDIEVEPISLVEEMPKLGTVIVSSKLPSTIISNKH